MSRLVDNVLHDLALLDDTLDLSDKEGADTHCFVLAP